MWNYLPARPGKVVEQVFSTPGFPALGQDDDHQQYNDEECGHRKDEKLIV